MSTCPICGGIGLIRVISPNGLYVSQPCPCQEMVRESNRLHAARVPFRYQRCTLDSFDPKFKDADPSLGNALHLARRFVEEYPADTGRKGLMFVGGIGVGKSHLAVGVLLRLIRERGARGLFCDYRELLKNIQNSYNPQVQTTELELLKPVFAAEVLVIDDLGAQKPNDWLFDTVALIINTRYNESLATIVTTNYPDEPPASPNLTDEQRAAREKTLGDRIGERMRSRLAEMCIRVDMSGQDLRQSIERARFG